MTRQPARDATVIAGRIDVCRARVIARLSGHSFCVLVLAACFAISASAEPLATTPVSDVTATITGSAAIAAAGANAAPSMPRLPVVKAMKLEELAYPLPSLPEQLVRALEAARAGDDDHLGCEGLEPIAIRLSSSATLWGICTSMGAYNLDYAFYVVEGGGVRPTGFEPPVSLADEDRGNANVLTNPGLSEDGLTISSFYQGAGFGDCGRSGAWAWDGSQFRLVDYRRMDECHEPDNWAEALP